MQFKEFAPSERLKPYIRSFYLFESNDDSQFYDTVFPSGSMEMIFNLGQGTWETAIDGKFIKTPSIELWGQITRPLSIRSTGKQVMLGVRLLPHSAACFVNEPIGIFNDCVSDLSELIGGNLKTLHSQLIELEDTGKRIKFVEAFLEARLSATRKKSIRIDKVASILSGIKKNIAESSICDIAMKHGITARYVHKLIYQHTGLSPKSFNKINRFQRSLNLISKNNLPLTTIAYDCGYFDQSHFIRDFKSFTSVTPSAYLENKFPINQIFFQ